MSEQSVSQLRWRVCERKVALGRAAAMTISERERGRGQRMTAYRCPFDGDHWHVGHPVSMSTLARIAEFLRERHAA